jgi:hypothetical protein
LQPTDIVPTSNTITAIRPHNFNNLPFTIYSFLLLNNFLPVTAFLS